MDFQVTQIYVKLTSRKGRQNSQSLRGAMELRLGVLLFGISPRKTMKSGDDNSVGSALSNELEGEIDVSNVFAEIMSLNSRNLEPRGDFRLISSSSNI